MLLKKMFMIGAVLLGGFMSYVAMLPAEMHISREIVINNSPEAIFPFINNSQKANEWMPWKDSDPAVQINYSGPDEGVGSRSSWNSSGQMGTGEALVVESITNELVKTKLSYTKPFQMEQLAQMTLSPVDGGTRVTWSVSGKQGFLFKLIGVFVSCEEMVGGEFEKGLAKLKHLSTTHP